MKNDPVSKPYYSPIFYIHPSVQSFNYHMSVFVKKKIQI